MEDMKEFVAYSKKLLRVLKKSSQHCRTKIIQKLKNWLMN